MEVIERHAFQNLLSQVSSINKKYEEFAEITGEKFNIFKVLKIEKLETVTHTPILREFLNPQGSHGQGSIFLKLFISQLNINDFEIEGAQVNRKDVDIGIKDKDCNEGGRIDILIHNKKKCIIIENKIDKNTEQCKQMFQYYNYGKKEYGQENLYLFYLTPMGDKPSEQSTNKILHDSQHYKTISYKKDIKEWLELCQKESSNYPLLRETITQYINLIKFITNQTMSDKMNEELISQITKSSENIEVAFAIADAMSDNLRKWSLSQLKWQIEELLQEIKNEIGGFNFNLQNDDNFYPDGFSVWLSEIPNCKIEFGFDEGEDGRFYCGIVRGTDISNINLPEMEADHGETANEAWVWWKYVDCSFNRTGWREIPKIINNKSLKIEIKEYIKRLITNIK